MGSPDTPPLPPALVDAFRAAPGHWLPFDRFMALALYHPEFGYYRRNRARVGYGAGTDFFTASTSGPVFGELVVASAVTLLRAQGASPEDFTFVEIGAESAGGILAGVSHPFANARAIAVGSAIELRGRSIVFSNELFDAQPFRRLIRQGGRWLEDGVAWDPAIGGLSVASGGPATDSWLPEDLPDGYRIDAPVAAATLAAALGAQGWTGLFLGSDYGKSWAELTHEHPAGTARAYFQHTQSNDLLTRPGEQDLTCHVCWDWIADALTAAGFAKPQLEAQEAFFVRHAAGYLEGALKADAAQATARKRSLLQLLHPAHLGRKFQVLHAWRGEFQDSP